MLPPGASSCERRRTSFPTDNRPLDRSETGLDHDELIFRALQGRISSKEEEELRAWRKADPRHEERYQGFAAVWRVTREYDEAISTTPPPVDAVTAMDPSAGRARRRWHGVLWPAAAAAAAFVVGLGVAQVGSVGEVVAPEAVAEVVTGVGETATARLPDGTVVRVAPESRLVLPAAGNEREVSLDGQAFFAVVRNPEEPFMVRTPSGDARVLGTRFELAARGGHFRLLVVEGEVAVSSSDTEVSVGPRQMTHLREGEQPATVEVEDVWALLGWMGQFLAFESTPLREVRAELERRFDVRLQFDDPALADETVTVWFGDEPIEEIASVLCRLVESECAMDDSLIRMSRRP